jgi:predicted  nucleic acid-binding Zn-ribbon protein
MDFEEEQLISRNLRVELSDVRAGRETAEDDLTKLREERDDLSGQLVTATQTMDELKNLVVKAEQQTSEFAQKMNATIRQSEMAASNDKKAIQQLTETVKKSRMAEEGLRAEIEMFVDRCFAYNLELTFPFQ